jgi:hypothetical protein
LKSVLAGCAVAADRAAVKELIDGAANDLGDRESLFVGVVAQGRELGLAERHEKPGFAAGWAVVFFE